MLRNLLYSLFFHILFITILVLSTLDLNRTISTSNVTPLTISFLNDNTLEDIKNIKANKENEKVKDLNLEEKIDLYNKIKNKGNGENMNVVYEKSTKKPQNKASSQGNKDIEENTFDYHYTPVYVLESKVNTQEKLKLIENRLKREELRKKIKDKNAVPDIDILTMKNTKTLEDIIKISQRPLVVKKKQDKNKVIEAKVESTVAKKTTTTVAENKEIKAPETQKVQETDTKVEEPQTTPEEQSDNNYLDELVSEINIANEKIDDKYKDLNENEIFNQADYEKLKEIDENKIDSKYALSIREKVNIQRQIKGCYKMAILRSKQDSKAVIGLTVNVAQDGVIDIHNVKVNKIVDNYDDNGFEIALDNAKSALVFCSPLRGLPVGKYKTWKYMTFIFDSNNLE